MMKKILLTVLALVMVVTVSIGFAGCDKYKNTEYELTSFVILKADGTELNIREYKNFFDISYSDEGDIIHTYGKSLATIDDVKSFILTQNSYKFVFGKDNKVQFVQNTITNKVLGESMEYTWNGEYSFKDDKLGLKFYNYKLDDKSKRMTAVDGTYIVELTSELYEFEFGKAYGNLNVTKIDDKTFKITLYSGISTSSNRAEMVFTKK